MESNGQISLNFNYKVNFKDLFGAFSQIKDIKHIERNFHSVPWVMPQGWELGGAGGSNILVWVFAMAPH